MLRLLFGKDWTANRDEILKRVAEDVQCRREKRILLVPELISHEMERRLSLAAGDTASRYAEVLSFTRLANRVSDSVGRAAMECLDDGGRVVAMAAAAKQLSSRLKAYAAVETKPEFLTELVDAVDEFKRCCITSQDLALASKQTEGSLAQKLEELSLLLEGYDGLCSRGRRDPRDKMVWLLEQLEISDYAREHVLYIDGFPDFTRQNLSIIEHFIRHSPCVTISLNCDQMDSKLLAFEKAGDTAKEIFQCAQKAGIPVQIEYIPTVPIPLNMVRDKIFQGSIPAGSAKEHLRVLHMGNPYQECMSAAERVMDLVRKGCRYRDITIVCTDTTVYQPILNLIFHRFQIPLYQSGTEEILNKNVISTVLAALDVVSSGFEQRSVLRYIRSALSPLTDDICDLLENYAVVWGIRGRKWAVTWENHPDGLSAVWDTSVEERLAVLNEAREMVIEPLLQLRDKLRDANNLREQVTAVYLYLDRLQFAKRLSEMACEMEDSGDYRSAQILNQLWEILISALEQMYDVLGDTYWEMEQFERLFKLLLSQYHVGTIPPVLDAVQVGPVSAMRCHQEKHLIILGAEEGRMPGYTGSSGILTDQERVALRQIGVPLTGGAMEGIQAEFAEIYGVFCGAMESICVAYSGEQPSFVTRRLASLAGGEGTVSSSLGFAAADALEAGIYLAGQNACQEAGQLNVQETFSVAQKHLDYHMGAISFEGIQGLYGETLNLSASQIEQQAECRMSYFLKYGMRAKERKEAVIDPAEFGTYVHAVLENTVRCIHDMGGFSRVSMEETLEIAHRFSDAYAKEHFSQIASERMTYLFQRNIRELDMVVEDLWKELSQSLFSPEGFEVSFGGDGELSPIPIPNGSIRAVLRGFVDRVDIWNNGYCNYYRVVDYKTGKKAFDYCDVFNGVGLQMLLYMFALRNNGSDTFGESLIPAGVLYHPARAPYLTAERRMEAGETLSDREKAWKRSGLLLQDEAVLRAMEPGEEPVRMCYSVKKDGTMSGDLADRQQMRLLETHVFQVLASLVEEIASGNVEANPYTRGSNHNACSYCPYGMICHPDMVEGRRNYQRMTSQEFWEALGREADNGR